ncbi:hypothetical protein ACLMJK_001211 [Lecanora helva]
MHLTILALAALSTTLITASPVPQSDGDLYLDCLDICSGDQKLCLNKPKGQTSADGVTFLCAAQQQFCQLQCSNTYVASIIIDDGLAGVEKVAEGAGLKA